MVINVKMARLYNLWQQWLGKEAMPKKSICLFMSKWAATGSRKETGKKMGKEIRKEYNLGKRPNVSLVPPTCISTFLPING